MNNVPSITWSKFAAERHVRGSGNSFFRVAPFAVPGEDEVIERVHSNWDLRKPGTGETGLDRKILVPVSPDGFYVSMTPLRDDLPLKAEVVRRQPHEDPYVEIYLDVKDAERLGLDYIPAKFCDIVLYSKDTLLENNGERSSDADWEIVAVLARLGQEDHMPALTMARNFLEKAGGTKSVYTAQEFAESIYANSKKGVRIKASK